MTEKSNEKQGTSGVPLDEIVMLNKFTHKETFYQPGETGIPATWCVFYWNEGQTPDFDTHECAYFNSEDDATEFGRQMIQYDDWLTLQETQLPVQ